MKKRLPKIWQLRPRLYRCMICRMFGYRRDFLWKGRRRIICPHCLRQGIDCEKFKKIREKERISAGKEAGK